MSEIMDLTDDDQDSSWAQAELDEQSMLSADPAYFEWLKQYEVQ